MRRAAVLAAVLLAGVPAAAAARTTKVDIVSDKPNGVLLPGERIYVVTGNYLPRHLCGRKARFKLTDAAGRKYKLGRLKVRYALYPEGEANGTIGTVPDGVAPGEGTLRSKQKCRAGSASGRQRTYVPPPEPPRLTALATPDGLSGKPVRFSFSIDKRAMVAITVEYELLPGDWREVDRPVTGAYLTKPGSYTYDWRAKVGSAVPAGHYRVRVALRSWRGTGAADTRTRDFHVARAVGDAQLTRVVDGQVDGSGLLVVPDADRDHLRVFGPLGDPIATLAPPLDEPKDVAFSPDGSRIYVADTGNRRIAVVDRGGALVGSFGSAGAGAGQFSAAQGPQGIAATGLNGGRVYVADGDQPEVEAFDLAGAPAGRLTGPDVNDPFSVAVAADGTLWLADAGSNKLVRLAPDGAQLAAVDAGRPFGVDVDARGRVIASDAAARVAVVRGPDGTPLATVGRQLLTGPGGVAAAGRAGDFYVLDGAADRVFAFRVP